MTAGPFLPVLCAFALAWAATWGTRRIFPALGVLDTPNARSSHTEPRPTLGGIGLIVGAVGGVFLGRILGVSFESVPLRALAGTTLILLIFSRDEVRPLRQMAKLGLQCASSALLISSGIVLEKVTLPFLGAVHLGAYGIVLTLLWMVAVQNIHNFMDGIDGLVGTDGLIVFGVMAALLAAAVPDAALLCVVVAAACGGFVLWNLPPARIFMGDVGSHFIGLFLATAAVIGERNGIPIWLGVVAMGAFLHDGFYTILRRLLRGENIVQAHRFHIYQRLVRLGASHGHVTAGYAGLTALLGATCLLSGIYRTVLGILCFAVTVVVTIAVESAWRRRGEAL